MSAAETPRLTVVEAIPEPIVVFVDGQTLVIHPDDERWPIAYQLGEKEQDLKRAERDLRGKRALIEQLRNRNRDEDELARKTHPKRKAILAVIERWRTRSGHVRAKITPQRFDMTAARFGEDYEPLDLHMAVEGLIARAWTDPEGERHDDLKVCMKEGSQVERYANLAPAEIRRELREEFKPALDPQQKLVGT